MIFLKDVYSVSAKKYNTLPFAIENTLVNIVSF